MGPLQLPVPSGKQVQMTYNILSNAAAEGANEAGISGTIMCIVRLL